MLKAFLFSVVLLLIPTNTNAEKLTLNQILESTCRVQSGDALGSGSCIKYESGKYWILSNAHVVGRNKTAYVEFFKNGRKTLPIPAKVEWVKLVNKTEIDFAILSVDEKYFGKYPPRVARLAPLDAMPVGGYVVSAGCPGARWPTAWEGFLIDDGKLLFYPPPIGGQSGSGLYIVCKENDKYQTYLKGVVTWRVDGGMTTTGKGYENAHGAAVSIDRLIDAIEGRTNRYDIPDNYQQVELPKLFPRIKPQPEPSPSPVPDNPAPDVSPDGPYDNLPDFDNAPILPPVDTIDKVEDPKVPEVSEDSEVPPINWFPWLGGAGVVLTSWLAVLAFQARKSIASWIGSYFKKKESELDIVEDRLMKRLEPILGAKNTTIIRSSIEEKEEAVLDRIISRIDGLVDKKSKEVKVLSESESLMEEVANNLIESIDTSALKAKVKSKLIDILKN